MPETIKVEINFELLEDAKDPLEAMKEQLLSNGIPVDTLAKELKVITGKLEQIKVNLYNQYWFTWINV